MCSGIGIAGLVFSKILLEKGHRIKLTLIDIRRNVLLKAREWVKKELNIEPIIHVVDAKTIHSLGEEYDLILIWGSSSPHFNPWDMNKLLASISYVLNDKGLLIMQEADRFYSIITRGYKEIIFVEDEYEGKTVLDVFKEYNPLKGTCRRKVIDIKNPAKTAAMDLYYWSIAGIAALLWVFFEDIDILEVRGQGLKYITLAYKPRKTISPAQFEMSPYVFRKKSKDS